MRLKRVVRYLNLLILLLLLAAAAIVYWYAWRPLPETSGTLQAPVAARGEIVRDRRGFPHIRAASIDDALFLQGFACAQDRMWQMDGLRRAAAGRLAEVIGPELVEVDRGSRRLRMERLAEQHAASLRPADRAAFAAYARGVNYYLETHRARLPLEFHALGYDPRPWRIADTILIGLYMYRDLTTTWPFDLEKGRLLEQARDRAKIAVLYPERVADGVQPGSNNWVIAGSRTASGKPLLANDPHLGYSIPGIWHVVHLQAPGLDVAGAALPGVPSVIIGHNDRIAWGATNLGFDVQDLYIEQLDMHTGRCVFRGRAEQAAREREVIQVKGGGRVEYTQWVTRHGPVAIENGRALALRWTAAEPDSYQFPFLDLDRARNWTEFVAALSRYPGPGQNFVYADVDGNIGYQATGRLPIRRNYDGGVPVDGASGEYEWDGFIPFEQLPRVFNPPSEMVATANQDPFPSGYPYRVEGEFAAPGRIRQIRDLLSARARFRPEDMLLVQKDVYWPYAHRMARAIVAACDRKRVTDLGDEVAVLRAWNGQAEKGTAAPLIAALASQHLRKALLIRALGDKPELPQHGPALSILEGLVRARPAGWFSDWDAVLVQALRDGLGEGRRMQGGNVRRWDWGKYNALMLAHPVGSHIPLVRGYFDIGPIEQSGSPGTVKQTTRRLGPSMRFVADTSDWDRSLLVLVTGESGHVLSSHYKDNWDAYYAGRALPFPFRKVNAKGTLVFEPR